LIASALQAGAARGAELANILSNPTAPSAQ
jgi:hypothetical protein